MAMTKTERKQRLRTLENQIRKNLEAFVVVGNSLAEIQEKNLFLEHVDDEGEPLYLTWTNYLAHKVDDEFGIAGRHAKRLVLTAQIRPRLPDLGPRAARGWTQREIEAFTELAPQSSDHSQRYDFHRIDKQQAKRVTTSAIELAGGVDALNSTFIKKAIAAELGNKPQASKEQEQTEDSGIALDAYLRKVKGTSEGWLTVLEAVPVDAWGDYAGEVDEAVSALESLLKFLRS